MTTIVKATSKGQITIPMAWRRQFNTNQFAVQCQGDKLILRPIDLKKILAKDRAGQSDTIIFDAVRDNNGKGIPAREFIKTIKKMNG